MAGRAGADLGEKQDLVGELQLWPWHYFNIFVSQVPLLFVELITALHPSQDSILLPRRLNEIMMTKSIYTGCCHCKRREGNPL